MMIIKIGGGQGIRYEAIFSNLKQHLDGGAKAVVVHGANYEMAVLCERLGHPQRTLTSISGVESRYTDPATMDLFKMAYCGKVNKSLVELCQRMGINAVGLSGLDGALLTGPRKEAIRVVEEGKRKVIRDDLSGKVETVNVSLIRLLIDQGYLPMVCPPALSNDGQAVNVDGDRAAAVIAGALGAEQLIILSNVPGLLRDPADESSLITEVRRGQLAEFDAFAKGRMKKKTMAAAEALDAGVGHVIFADGRAEAPIDSALNRIGTWFH